MLGHYEAFRSVPRKSGQSRQVSELGFMRNVMADARRQCVTIERGRNDESGCVESFENTTSFPSRSTLIYGLLQLADRDGAGSEGIFRRIGTFFRNKLKKEVIKKPWQQIFRLFWDLKSANLNTFPEKYRKREKCCPNRIQRYTKYRYVFTRPNSVADTRLEHLCVFYRTFGIKE